MGYVRAYRAFDEIDLAPRLRKADLQEIAACSGRDPVEVLQEGAALSAPSCTVIGNSGFVAAMFGVHPEGDFGRVWLLGSDELCAPPLSRQFIRECRDFLAVMERPYNKTGNFIDQRNTVHIRWLKWLGYEFKPTVLLHGFLEFSKCVHPYY